MWLRPPAAAVYWGLRATRAALRRAAAYGATVMHRATLGAVGRGSRFQAGVRFATPRDVRIGRHCYFWRGCHASAETGHRPLTIGDHVQVNRDVHLDMTGGLRIGDRVLISEGAVIYTHDHGLDPRAAPMLLEKTIGDDVWIGMQAVILPQCRDIGEGAVIGAGAVVTRDVPAFTVVAGNPARPVGRRGPARRVAA